MKQKQCILYDRECIDCLECQICDLDPYKLCDNCGECLHMEDVATIRIDGIITDADGSDIPDFELDKTKF